MSVWTACKDAAMESITVRLPPGRECDERLVRFWGERRLHDFADTGVFTISTDAPGETTDRRAGHPRQGDALADLTIEVDGKLDIADSERGANPYERDDYSRRTISR